MIFDKLKLRALDLLPKNAVSRAFGLVSDVPLPPGMRGVVNRGFAAYAGIDLSESERTPGEYPSLNAFFTRRVKEGTHEVASEDPADLLSPADGVLNSFGPIERNTLVQAKGREYSLVDLLDSGREAALFEGGSYATVYLSPRDYHRVHSPTSGEVTRLGYVPGHLFPVNPFAANNIEGLFAVNERLITYINNAELGAVAVVMVGATCVGRMSLAFDDFVTNRAFRRREDLKLPRPVELAHGEELGMFNLGSTVILVVSNPDFTFDEICEIGLPVRMGQRLGGA